MTAARILFGILLVSLQVTVLPSALVAQPNFDIGNSEVAVWNTQSSAIPLTISASGLIFDNDLKLTHRFAVVSGGYLSGNSAWGYEGPWSMDAASGDIDEVKDTLGCGLYLFDFNDQSFTFTLNLTDAIWGAGSTTSVYRILIEYDDFGVKIYVRTYGSSGAWSSAFTPTNGGSYTYWGLVQWAFPGASYLRERTTYDNKRFHVTGGDNQLPLESTGVTEALLDVNLDVHVDINVPDGSALLIEGFDEGLYGDSDTRLLFDEETGLTVFGELETMRHQYRNEYVLFLPSSGDPAAGDWDGILCERPYAVTLNRVFIAYAVRGLDCDHCDPITGSDVTVNYSLESGVRLIGSNAVFHDLISSSNVENNLEVARSEALFYDSYFNQSDQMMGVLLEDAATVLLQHCTINENHMTGIYAHTNAFALIDSCTLYNNGWIDGQDYQGVYSFYNGKPVFLRHSVVKEQSIGLCAVWGKVYGYYDSSLPATWDNPDSLGRNCVAFNDYNLWGYYATYEFGKAYYDQSVPHYQGGENTIVSPYTLQGGFEYSNADLQRDFWDGNTLFSVSNSTVSTADALTADSTNCTSEDVMRLALPVTASMFNVPAAARFRTWEALDVDSLRTMLFNQRATLSALDASVGFGLVWERSDSTAARAYFSQLAANCVRPEVLIPAYRYLAAVRMEANEWNAAVQALQSMAQLDVYGGEGYTSAQAMAALTMHRGGATAAARASLDTLLQAFPGNRDLTIVDQLIGHEGIPRQAREQTMDAMPVGYAMQAAWPNPFARTTSLAFTLPESGEVTVSVHDILGREVRTLATGWYPKGTSNLVFNAGNLSSGVYLVRMITRGVTLTQTVRILR